MIQGLGGLLRDTISARTVLPFAIGVAGVSRLAIIGAVVLCENKN